MFYFAGHGSKLSDPPDELMHLAANDRQLETVVCQDSRGPNGADLVDQEIAHLIGTSTRRAGFFGNGHFVAIMDCCHAGHGTRLEEAGKTLDSRSVGDRHSQSIDDFYGYSPGRMYPQRGPHVQLAACGHHQEAYDGKFTPILIQDLQTKGPGRSYAQISRSVSSTISRDTTSKQVPEIYANPSPLGNLPFLGGSVH